MTVRELAARLKQYDEQEARSIVRFLLYDCFGMTMTDICTGALERMTADETVRLNDAMQRLEHGEPLQYVTGKTVFCGRDFHVEEGVLIPRPETEELCEMIISGNTVDAPRILDVGTGSGCIAVTLALSVPNAEVTAWDISDDALRIACDNAKRLSANVNFEKRNVLDKALSVQKDCYDIIVSNPPYICNREAIDMRPNVLDYEPHLALFVPDDDPLLFYRTIAELATQSLKHGGSLCYEINPLYAEEMCAMLNHYAFTEITLHKDQFGKQRFIIAER